MPGMDGLELLDEIKQRRPDLPVMMVTAYGDDERRCRTRELGAFEFITKPIDFDQLKEQLRQLPPQRIETAIFRPIVTSDGLGFAAPPMSTTISGW